MINFNKEKTPEEKEYFDVRRKIQDEVLLFFLNAEKEKGEGCSIDTEQYLCKKIEEFEKLGGCIMDDCYYSGRKVVPFDRNAIVYVIDYSGMHIGDNMLYPASFCEQEIESYARSYRVFKITNKCMFGTVDGVALVQVSEFKPDKI